MTERQRERGDDDDVGPRCRCWHALCAGTSPENAFLRNTGWKGQSETNYFSPPTQPRLVVRTLAHTVSSHLSVCAVSDHGYVDYSTQKTNESSTRTAIDVALDDTGGVGQFLRILNELGANTTKCVHQFQSPLGIGRRRKHVAGL